MKLIDNGHPFALRDFTAAQRKALAKSGKAMPDGSFPIENEEDLHNAIRLAGHADNPAAAKAHIRSRAAAMGMSSVIPDDWTGGSKQQKKAASDGMFMLRPAFKFSHDSTSDLTWIQAIPHGEWDHPVYGKMIFTPGRSERYKANFDNNVMQQEVPWTFEHGIDKAKGNKAAGVVRELEVREDGLYAGIKFTPTALQELRDGEWLYNSPEIKDEWTSPADGETYEDVFWGGSVTNYPFLKGIAPINLSDLSAIVAEVADKEHSEPGTGIGGEPGPRTDYDKIAPAPPLYPPNPDPSVKPPGAHVNNTGNLIFSEGGVNKVDEAELRKLLGIDDTVMLNDHITQLMADAAITQRLNAEADKLKAFADAYPEEARRLAELSANDRANEAKKFADSFTKIKAGEDGKLTVRFTPNAVEAVEQAALKFSDGSVTLEDFGSVLHTIAKSGVVEISERGSSLAPEDRGELDGADAGTQLSDLAHKMVSQAQAEGKELALSDALQFVARSNPELYAAYRSNMPNGGWRAMRNAGVSV